MAFSAGVAFLNTRIIIEYGGPHTYAYVALVASIIAMIPFADLGTGAAVTNALAEGSGDLARDQNVSRALLTSLRILTIAGSSVALAACAIYAVGAWDKLLGFEAQQARQLSAAVTISICAFGLSLPFGIGQRVLLGVGRNHLAVVCQATSPVVTLGSVLSVVALQLSPWLVACAPGLALLITNAVTTWVAARTSHLDLREVFASVPRLGSRAGVSIRQLAGPMILVSVALPIAFQSDRVILANFSTADELASYSLGAQLYAPFWAVISSAGLTLWPTFAAARTAHVSAVSALHRSILALVLASSLGCASLLLLGAWAGRVLSGGTIALNSRLLIGFGLLLLVQSAHLPSGMALTDRSGLRFQAKTVVAMLVINITLSILLVPSLGAAGPLIASVVAVGVCQLVPCYRTARAATAFLNQKDAVLR